jgi:uncharacterized lipoprotein YmbA
VALACLVGAALLAGCAATPPVVFYTLTPLPSADIAQRTAGAGKGLTVGVGPVTFPDYLDRPQIVTRPSPNRIEISEFHRWGGSLKQALTRVLSENIAGRLGADPVAYPWKSANRPTYRVAVDILHFEGRLGNSVNLEAAWSVKTGQDRDEVSKTNRATIDRAVASEDYEAFVAAQSQALAALADAIVGSISD